MLSISRIFVNVITFGLSVSSTGINETPIFHIGEPGLILLFIYCVKLHSTALRQLKMSRHHDIHSKLYQIQ